MFHVAKKDLFIFVMCPTCCVLLNNENMHVPQFSDKLSPKVFECPFRVYFCTWNILYTQPINKHYYYIQQFLEDEKVELTRLNFILK